jgi:hypothetical protein
MDRPRLVHRTYQPNRDVSVFASFGKKQIAFFLAEMELSVSGGAMVLQAVVSTSSFGASCKQLGLKSYIAEVSCLVLFFFSQ